MILNKQDLDKTLSTFISSQEKQSTIVNNITKKDRSLKKWALRINNIIFLSIILGLPSVFVGLLTIGITRVDNLVTITMIVLPVLIIVTLVIINVFINSKLEDFYNKEEELSNLQEEIKQLKIKLENHYSAKAIVDYMKTDGTKTELTRDGVIFAIGKAIREEAPICIMNTYNNKKGIDRLIKSMVFNGHLRPGSNMVETSYILA